jgi:hypothetical protein
MNFQKFMMQDSHMDIGKQSKKIVSKQNGQLSFIVFSRKLYDPCEGLYF